MYKMRELKFRGKRIDNGEWVYGSLIIEKDPIADVLKYFIKPFNFLVGKLVVPETIGQYLEAKDRNGKEIYESDIVRYNDKHVGVIIWKYTSFILELLNDKKNTIILWYDVDTKNNIEVIGNIYENPELLVLLSDEC